MVTLLKYGALDIISQGGISEIKHRNNPSSTQNAYKDISFPVASVVKNLQAIQ